MSMRMGSTPSRPIEDPRVKYALLALVVIIVGHAIFAAISFYKLPEMIPSFYHEHGKARELTEKSIVTWFVFWMISTGCAVLTACPALAIDRIPSDYLNMPKKEEFLSLRPAIRAGIFASLSFHIILFVCVMALFFFVIHVFTALTFLGTIKDLPLFVILGGASVLVIHGVALWFIALAEIKKGLQNRAS
ncbi:MAG: hypothetical protein GY854_06645 [Deltaproteobacteria bacterium]|nr:hypothetical protein [Deltaproteobacteria bacterium]